MKALKQSFYLFVLMFLGVVATHAQETVVVPNGTTVAQNDLLSYAFIIGALVFVMILSGVIVYLGKQVSNQVPLGLIKTILDAGSQEALKLAYKKALETPITTDEDIVFSIASALFDATKDETTGQIVLTPKTKA